MTDRNLDAKQRLSRSKIGLIINFFLIVPLLFICVILLGVIFDSLLILNLGIFGGILWVDFLGFCFIYCLVRYDNFRQELNQASSGLGPLGWLRANMTYLLISPIILYGYIKKR